MKIITGIVDLRKQIQKARTAGKTVGLVPTMGALHDGHASLIRACRRKNDLAVVSIFINPIQFGPKDDLKRYPRNIKKDSALCKKYGADIIFMPDARQMYPKDFSTFVSVGGVQDVLCAKSRPGHFQGVATVVSKLINIVCPDDLYFGQKDAQQTVVIKKMCRDLNFPVRVLVLPTVRSQNGLALSSRNSYLGERQKKDALVLYRSLVAARKFIRSGIKDVGYIVRKMTSMIKKVRSAKIDYISIVSLEHLVPLKKIDRPCLVALAVRIGRARLIDNMIMGAKL